MKYGYFDNEKKEYIITNPKTPVKWINYIGTLKFGGFVDQTGGLQVCKQDPALNRITKYIPQMPSSEFKGSTIYIRFKENNGYKIFSPFFVPTLDKYDSFECHVGLLYTKFITEFYGIKSEITIFVPVNAQCVIQDIKITNTSKKPLDIDIIPVVEYSHVQALLQYNNADWVPQTMQSRLVEDKTVKIIRQYAFKNIGEKENYFTSNHLISSFETDRKVFLGDNEYGTYAKPLSLLNRELSNTLANRGDNIAAILSHLGEIKPGETKRIITQLGQVEDINKALPEINKYLDEKEVDKAFIEIKNFWDDYLSKVQVQTPDVNMNNMLNIHNPRQCYITKNWSRYLSLYQLGLDARGIGFRDSSQDAMGIIANKPEEGKDLIKLLLSIQNRDGSAMHQVYPLTMVATTGEAEDKNRPRYYGDDHLWIVLAVCEYIKETNNLKFLEEIIPYYEKDKDNNNKPFETGSVLDHLNRAVEFTHANTGKHGLPFLGFADWNDCVNLMPPAESLFNANLYGYALKELIDLMDYLCDKPKMDHFKKYYDEMRDSVNQHAWDGEWYISYFDNKGIPMGSSKNLEGKIYCYGQSWPVISGFAPLDRSKKALDSVNKLLNTKNGIKLSYPGFKKFDPLKGGITTYPPGAKENGGIFLHVNPWVMIAETIIGNGDRAFLYYNQINPSSKNDIIDEYECEPYCYPQNILGDEHPQFGLGRNSWLSGTSSWVYQASIKYILGVRATYKGLIIDPCIPGKWKEFKITRKFRNATYLIEVKNPEGVSKGVISIVADEKNLEGNIIPAFNDNKEHKIIVTMG